MARPTITWGPICICGPKDFPPHRHGTDVTGGTHLSIPFPRRIKK